MPCLLHTDMSGDSPEEYFITLFDPPGIIKCQCPGTCEGILEFEANLVNGGAILCCSVCHCAYAADQQKDKK